MRPLVTPAEMRRADEASIAAGQPAELLMERAGRAVARAVIREAGRRYGRRIVVVCGKGNNGGDGYVAARVLHHEGLHVVCCTTFDPEEAKGAARHHLDLLRAAGCTIRRFDARYLRADVIVDAVFGTGFRGQPEGDARDALTAIDRAVRRRQIVNGPDGAEAVPAAGPRPRVVSVDVPSAGLIQADVTVALGAEKLDTFFGDPDAAGTVEVAGIGISVTEARVYVIESDDVVAELPDLRPDDHKTSHGSVVVIAGSDLTTGAALLTARAAARMGAGYVTLVSTARVVEAANVRLPEVLKKRLDRASFVGPGALDDAAGEIERADAVALGPGLGRGEDQTALVERAVREIHKPMVLDADALNALVGRTSLLSEREWPCVVTPHAAEMARLLDVDTSEVLADRAGIALRAAAGFGCTIVLKGRNTLVASPSGGMTVGRTDDPIAPGGPEAATAWAIAAGGPELATAGTGDVLTGAAAAGLARGGVPHGSVAMTCFVHGVAGGIAAARSGATGLVAWDVAEALPAAVWSIRAAYAD